MNCHKPRTVKAFLNISPNHEVKEVIEMIIKNPDTLFKKTPERKLKVSGKLEKIIAGCMAWEC